MRLVAAVTLSVILLPFILQLFLTFSREDSPSVILNKLVSAIPFGNAILKVVSAVLTDAMSNQGSLLDWMSDQEFTFPQYFTMEMGKMVFSGVILALLTKLQQVGIEDKKRKGWLNRIADMVYLTLFVFSAGLLTDLLFEFFDLLVKDTAGIFRDIFVYIYSGGLGVAGVVLLVISGMVLLDAVLSVVLNCFKMAWTYAGVMWMLLCSCYGSPVWLTVLGIAVWAGLVLLIQRGEDLVLK